MQLLKQGKKNWLTEERIGLLDEIDFDWNPIMGDNSKKRKGGDATKAAKKKGEDSKKKQKKG